MFLGRKAAFSIRALNRMSALAGAHMDPHAQSLSDNVRKYQEESERVRLSCNVILCRGANRGYLRFQEVMEVCRPASTSVDAG